MDDKERENVDKPETNENPDNIYYVYEDDEEENPEMEEHDMDNSSYNYSQMPTDIQETDETEEDEMADAHQSSVFKLLIKILTNPVEGWKAVRREKLSVERAQHSCFYPLLALLALSNFAHLFYDSRVELSEVIISAVTNFVGYFAGYFCIVILLKTLLPKDSGKAMDTDFGKVFVIMNLSSLCIFFTAMELLPMLSPVLIFLPLWTVYVICRGTRFFRFPEDKTIYCTTLLCLLIIGVPEVIEWVLNEVLPSY